ncbi:MAG: DUF4411 family protein [Spirochaetales bacterium]|nr:DUF4411 family protein [Spirochaetales bacterium]
MFCLDTNVIIDATSTKNRHILSHFIEVDPNEIVIPAIVVAELEYGARHSRDYQGNISIIRDFIAPYRIVPFYEREAVAYGKIRQQLTADGKIIGANDMLIAATALAHNATVVTHNIKEFSRVSGVDLIDWIL